MKLEWLLPYSTLLFKSERGVWCKVCNSEFTVTRSYHIKRHVKGPQHLEKMQNYPGPFTDPEPCVSNADFYMDLCEAFITADIPLHKTNHRSMRTFLEKHCHRKVPEESTLRKNYVDKVYLKTMNKIRHNLEGKKLWFSVDETTDIKGRYVANIIVGPLIGNEPESSYLIYSKFLSKTNSETITKAVVKSITLLLPATSIRENVVLFLSDNPPYMLKAGRQLKKHFPKLLHLTCLAHALHGICEMVHNFYPLIDTLVSEVKKVFLKSPARITKFKDMCPNVALPPQPVITSWGTWLSAVTYYHINFNEVKNVIDSLQDDALSVKKSKEIINSPSVKSDLKFIFENFGYLPDVIEQLEKQNAPLVTSFHVFQTTIDKLKIVPNEIGDKLKLYIPKILKRNPGFLEIKNIFESLQNSENDLYNHFRFAPVTSCDVERSFPRLRDVLNYKRTNLTETNFEKMLVISCNANKL